MIVCGKITKCNIIILVQSCVSGTGIKMAWWLLFYLGKVYIAIDAGLESINCGGLWDLWG